MNERFIKFIPSEESDYLQENHPNAFLLLCLIAKRARRLSGHPDGLEIGEAHIGDYKKAGINSEKQYRTAKKILFDRGHVKFIESCRTRAGKTVEIIENVKKGATGRATTGTKVKLLRSDIWDINYDLRGDPIGDRGATEGRPRGDEQERIRKNKKEEREQPTQGGKADFLSFREFVMLTQKQYDTLVSKHGKLLVERMLDILDAYKGSSGKKYASDYHTMKDGGWVVTRATEQSKVVQMPGGVDRRTKNQDGTPVTSPADGRF